MKRILKPPHISDQEKSPLVEQLLELIEQQNFLIQQLTEQIQLKKMKSPGSKINRPGRISSSAAWKKRRSTGFRVKSVPVPRNAPKPSI
jgi:hypothetical protein